MRRILKLICLISMFIIPIQVHATSNEQLKTVKITRDTLTESSKQKILSDFEIEEMVNSAADKSFKEIISVNVNHIGRDITIKYIINQSDGTLENLINTSIYNYINLIKEFDSYNTNFEVTIRYKDNNNRLIKKHMYSYTFNSGTIKSLDWQNISYKNFIENSDKYWNLSDGEVTNNKNNEDDLHLKIINIFKTYIQYKLNEK